MTVGKASATPFRRYERARLAAHVILAVACLLAVVPLYWAIKVSLSPSELAVRDADTLWPTSVSLDGYRRSLDADGGPGILRACLNSTLLATAACVTQLVSCGVAAWLFAHYQWRGKNFLFASIMAAATVPTVFVAVPNLITVRDLTIGLLPGLTLDLGFMAVPGRSGWAGTLLGIAAPSLFFQPLVLIIMRQAFRSVPQDLVDAATVDGAGPMRVLWSIGVPLTSPTIVGAALLSYLDSWNEFLWPLVIAPSGPHVATVAVAQARSQVPESTLPDWQMLMSATVLASLPIVVLYLLTSRQVDAAIGQLGPARLPWAEFSSPPIRPNHQNGATIESKKVHHRTYAGPHQHPHRLLDPDRRCERALAPGHRVGTDRFERTR